MHDPPRENAFPNPPPSPLPFPPQDRIKPLGSRSPAHLISTALTAFHNRPALGQPWEWPDPHGLTSLSFNGYRWATYGSLAGPVRRLAQALREMSPTPGSHVGICGMNCIEWIIADFACALAGLVSVSRWPLVPLLPHHDASDPLR